MLFRKLTNHNGVGLAKNNRLNNRDFNIDQNNRDYDFSHNRAALLTTHESRMAGDTNPGLLHVHVHQPAFQTAAGRTEHLTHTHTHTHTHSVTLDNGSIIQVLNQH